MVASIQIGAASTRKTVITMAASVSLPPHDSHAAIILIVKDGADIDQFTQLHAALDASGAALLTAIRHSTEGVDITFSASKSVSLLMRRRPRTPFAREFSRHIVRPFLPASSLLKMKPDSHAEVITVSFEKNQFQLRALYSRHRNRRDERRSGSNEQDTNHQNPGGEWLDGGT